MNEFIVWDNLEEEFIDEEYIARYSDGVLFKADIDNEVIDLLIDENEDRDRFISFDYIRKDDINGKKIYADSSIIKFGKFRFKIKWDTMQLHYNLECLEDNDIFPIKLNGTLCSLCKIIDTIQENKLGLIK